MNEDTRNSLQTFTLLFVLFLSGFAGLNYEICWIRRSTLLFGATTLAISSVLAIFFGGLALGAYLFGKYSSKTNHPLIIYGLLEIIIGLIASINPILFESIETPYRFLYPLISSDFFLLSITRLILITLIILPPTVLMGGTLPLVCQYYSVCQNEILKPVGLIYAINTFGSAIGAIICGFLFLPVFGINKTILLNGSISILAGLTIITLDKYFNFFKSDLNSYDSKIPSLDEFNKKNGRPNIVLISCLFFLAGFTALGYEILWTRFLSLIINNTVYTYTITLAVILFGIFVGSLIVSFIQDRINEFPFYFGTAHILIGISIITILLLPLQTWTWLIDTEDIFTQVILCTIIMLVPAILSGIAFPLGIRMVVSKAFFTGKGFGNMTGINTFGGVAGSIVTGFIMLPLLGMQNVLIITTAISIGIGFLLIVKLADNLENMKKGVFIITGLVFWISIPLITQTKIPYDFLANEKKVIDYKEGLNSFLSVIKEDDDIILEIDRLWQAQKIKNYQIMAAHIPMLLHQDPKNVLVIGIGIGQAARRFLMYDINSLDCVDIEESLTGLIKKHFDSDWLSDTRVRCIVEDGRNYVAYTKNNYDIISIEVGQTFRPNIASFYSVDFYKHVKAKLKQNGLVSQFVPLGFLSEKDFLSVLNSFLSVFPHSTLWYNQHAELIMIGSVSKSPVLTSEKIKLMKEDRLINDDLNFSYTDNPSYCLNKPEVFIANFLMGEQSLNKMANKAPLFYDDIPVLEYQSAKYKYKFPSGLLRLIERNIDNPSTVIEKGIISYTNFKKVYWLQRNNLKNTE